MTITRSLPVLVLAFSLSVWPVQPARAIEPLASEAVRTAADAAAFQSFGAAVAISDDTMVVGSPHDSHVFGQAGAAYVFERNASGADTWGQVKKLTASDAGAIEQFGAAVAISGDTVIVGAPWDDAKGSQAGAAYVFERDAGGPGNWGQVKKLTATGEGASDFFGWSVGISGNTAVVGAYGDDDAGSEAGAAYVFERNGGGVGSWGQSKKLVPSDAEADEWAGWSVAISGDTVLVGAPRDNTSGRAYVFERNPVSGGSWGEVKKLAPFADDQEVSFGWSVAISGNTALVGAPDDRFKNVPGGTAYLFERNLGVLKWGRGGWLSAADAAAGDGFGTSVAINGDTVLVGAPLDDDDGDESGSGYLFRRIGTWQEVRKLAPTDLAAHDRLGTAVAVTQGAAVMGAPGSPLSVKAPGKAELVYDLENSACGAQPASDCAQGWQSRLLLVDEETPGSEQLIVRLRRGPDIQQFQFGDPRSAGGTTYQICLYDEANVLAGEIDVDAAGESCGAKPCWRTLGGPRQKGGFVYRHQGRLLKLHPGVSSRSFVTFEARNDGHGAEPVPSGIAARLAGSKRVSVQIRASDAACFAASMSAVKIDRPGTIKIKNR